MSNRLATFLLSLTLVASAAPLAAQPPSALEVALSEFRCHASDTVSATDAQRECLDTQIAALRADFGRDLSKLSNANRKGMDEACSRFTGPGQRTAYLLCVSDQLTALHSRQSGANANALGSAPPAVADAVGAVVPQRSVPPSRVPLWIGGALGIGVIGAGVFFVAAKSRRARSTCHACGVEVHDTDLCTKCRHEAAAAARHLPAASPHPHLPERPHLHAPTADHPPLHEHAPEGPGRVAVAVAPVVPAPAVPVAPAAPVAPVRVVPVVEAMPEEEVFDPYTVLGVSFEAGREKIRSAYEESKAKYDPELVSYLGDEAQARFRLKADEVERAYQILTGARVG